MGNFARVLHHLDMKDVKKRHLRELAARKIKEEQDKKEKKVIQEIAKKHKSDWRKDLREDFTVVSSGPTNSVTQTFQHASGQNFSFSGLGGQEVHPSTVTVFGDGVPAPNYNQLALAGYAKPLGNVLKRKELEDTNSKLDASQEFAKKVGADVMMNARVDIEAEQEKKAAKIIYNIIKKLPRTRFNQELKVLYGYLSGEMTEKITNEFISKKHLISLFKTAGMRGDGRVQMDDFIVGSGQKLIYDPNTDTYSMKFNYDFETNAQEILNTKLPYLKRLLLPIIGGKYGYDAGIFGRMVERAKELGFGQNIEGEFTISGEDLNKINPKLIELYNTHPAYMNDMGGFDTGHGYSSPPEWLNRWASKSQFSGDLRSLWDNKTRTWNLGGKIVDNFGKPINQGTFDKDGNYIPPGYEDAIGTDEISSGASEAEMKAGYEKVRKGVPNLPAWSDISSDLELPDIPKQGWTYQQYMDMLNALKDAAAKKADPIEKEIMRYSPTGFEGVFKTYTDQYGQRNTPMGLIDARDAITDALTKAETALTAKWEAYNKMPDLSGYGMDPSRDTETEARPVKGGQGGRRLGSTTQRQGGAYSPSSVGFDRKDTPFRKKKKNVRGSGARGGRKGKVNESNTFSKIKKILKERG